MLILVWMIMASSVPSIFTEMFTRTSSILKEVPVKFVMKRRLKF